MSHRTACLCVVLILSLIPFLSLSSYADNSKKDSPTVAESIPDGKITAPEKNMLDAFRINLKGSDGIKFGDTFRIIRGDKTIAEAYLVSTDPDRCVISIKGSASEAIQTGDLVRFVRHKKELPRQVVTNLTYLGLFKDVEGRQAVVACTKCGLQMDRSFISNFNDTDHYALCRGKTHEFYCRINTARKSGSAAQQQSTKQGSGTTESRDAQEIFKAPDNWTEKVSTTKYEDWGKKVSNPTLPTIGGSSGPPVVSGYGSSNGREIKMQIIRGNDCITVVSP
ncbi:MAG: hypothetical protein AB2L14_19580 [Candidatus Xenobiia bacterium LiM19]